MIEATNKTLNNIMEFDHVIQVHEDGAVSEPKGIYAPNLFNGELDSDKWAFFTTGYSGQDRYPGPIMHDSEFIGGGLARDVLDTPGVYVSLVCYWDADEDDEDSEDPTVEGWAIAYLTDQTELCKLGVHEYGEVEAARFTGNPHRKCMYCPAVTINFGEEDDD